MRRTATTVATIADRPDLVPIVAAWLWSAFDRDDGLTIAETTRDLALSRSRRGAPQTFVLLANGIPQGTASLLAADAPERPDLTPWLASVFVVPEARGRGYATRLVGMVEEAGRETPTPVLWLYTEAAEALYAGIGWRSIERFDRGGRDVVLMRRDLHTNDDRGPPST